MHLNLLIYSVSHVDIIAFCSGNTPKVASFCQGGERIEQSVSRMMTIIDLARNIRERHNKPLKTPLRYLSIHWYIH